MSRQVVDRPAEGDQVAHDASRGQGRGAFAVFRRQGVGDLAVGIPDLAATAEVMARNLEGR